MSPEIGKHSLECDVASMNFKETELTLGLPGESRISTEYGAKTGIKRGFLETVDLKLGASNVDCGNKECDESETDVSSAAKSPAAK